MRILHLSTNDKWGSGEESILRLIRGLKSRYFAENWVSFPPQTAALERFSHLCPILPLASSSGRDPRSILRLAKWIRHNHIHVIDSHSSKALCLALWVKKILPSIKLVVHQRMSDLEHDSWANRKHLLHEAVDCFIVDTPVIEKKLTAEGVPPRKISLIEDEASQAELRTNKPCSPESTKWMIEKTWNIYSFSC